MGDLRLLPSIKKETFKISVVTDNNIKFASTTDLARWLLSLKADNRPECINELLSHLIEQLIGL